MSSFLKWLFIVGSCVSAFLVVACRLQAQEVDWKNRLLKESVPRAKQARNQMSRVQGYCKWVVTVWDGAEKRKTVSYMQWNQRDNAALTLWQKEKAPPGEKLSGSVIGVNSRYRFRLERAGPDDPWIISSLEQKGAEETRAEGLKNPLSAYFRLEVQLNHGFSLYPRAGSIDPGPTDLSQSEFILKKVGPVNEGNEELVKAEFEYKNPEKPNWPLKSGWIVYDPQNYWVIRNYQLRRQIGAADSVINAKLLYKRSNNGVPLLTTEFVEDKTGDLRGTDEIEYRLEEGDVPESEFTLSAFGLPEPFGVRPTSTPWHLWGVAAGVVCIGAGAFLWRRYRQIA